LLLPTVPLQEGTDAANSTLDEPARFDWEARLTLSQPGTLVTVTGEFPPVADEET
jgi:hypothetical protein